MDNKNEQLRQEAAQDQSAAITKEKNSQQQSAGGQDPSDKMNDGTNDFKNGDQEPSSEASSTN